MTGDKNAWISDSVIRYVECLQQNEFAFFFNDGEQKNALQVPFFL